MLGCGRHRGSPPPIYAWLRPLSPLSHTGKSSSHPSCPSLQKQSDVIISTCFLLKDLNLCLDFFVTYSFSPPWPEADSFPILVFLSSYQCSSSSLCYFWIGSLIYLISTHLHSFLGTHPVLFIWTCTNIDFEWLVVLLEPHCQQHRPLKELFMLHQNRIKQYPGLHCGSQMDMLIHPCRHKKGLLKLVFNVNGFLEQLNAIFWQWDSCE